MRYIFILLTALIFSCEHEETAAIHYRKAYAEIVDVSDPRLLYPNSENSLEWFDAEHTPDSAYKFSMTYVSDRQQNRRWDCALPENRHSAVTLLEGGQQDRNKEIVDWYQAVRNCFRSLYQEVDTSKSITHTELLTVLLSELRSLAECPATKKVLICHSDAQQHMNTGKSIVMELSAALQKEPLPRHCGVSLIFVYKAVSMADDQAFHEVVASFRQVFKDYDITITSQAQNDIISSDK